MFCCFKFNSQFTIHVRCLSYTIISNGFLFFKDQRHTNEPKMKTETKKMNEKKKKQRLRKRSIGSNLLNMHLECFAQFVVTNVKLVFVLHGWNHETLIHRSTIHTGFIAQRCRYQQCNRE